MKKFIFAFALIALAGCENAQEKEAQQLVDQAQGLWNQVMPSVPGKHSGGTMVTSKDGLILAVNKLGEARTILEKVSADYPDTDVWKSEKTRVLYSEVIQTYRSSNETKQKMGW